MNQLDFGALMGQFKNLYSLQELLAWLRRVFELWEQDPDGKVKQHRYEIASALQSRYNFPLIDTGMQAPQNLRLNNPEEAKKMLLWGITILTDPMVRVLASKRQTFLDLTKELADT